MCDIYASSWRLGNEIPVNYYCYFESAKLNSNSEK